LIYSSEEEQRERQEEEEEIEEGRSLEKNTLLCPHVQSFLGFLCELQGPKLQVEVANPKL